jgi:flagellin-like hook-associated protein FlgL
MRISSRQLLEASQQSMQKSSVDTATWNQRISSGQRYERASQNPAAAGRAVELATRQSRIDSLKANQNAVENSMSEIDSQITGIRQAIASLTEVGVQARNGALGATGLTALAQNATQTVELLKSLVGVDNAAGTPMFGEVVVELEIEPDFKLPMSLTRTDVLGEGEKGKESVMAACQAIVDALKSGKAPSLDQMTALGTAAATVMAAQVKSGLVLGQIDASRSVMVASTDNVTRERGTLLETDVLEGATELTRSQTQLEAARNIFTRLDATGLFKKL